MKDDFGIEERSSHAQENLLLMPLAPYTQERTHKGECNAKLALQNQETSPNSIKIQKCLYIVWWILFIGLGPLLMKCICAVNEMLNAQISYKRCQAYKTH